MKFADLASTLNGAALRLVKVSETPRADARKLLAHRIGRSPAWLLAHPEASLTSLEQQAIAADLDRLEAGEPLPYVLGEWEFYGADFWVTPATLIPRPETELLVEEALNWLRGRQPRPLGLDIGTGTGCIAVSLALNAPGLVMLASDISLPALQVAQRNVQRYQLSTRVFCLQADLLPPLCQRVDLLCANLPYIPTHKLDGLRVARWEPRQALDGGATGLDLFERLLLQAQRWAAPTGLLLFEIEATLGVQAVSLSRQVFPQAEIRLLKDLAGLDRLVRIQIPD